MATRKETIRVCDQCEKETNYIEDGGYCGGHPLQGWLHLSEHGGSTRLAELRRKKEHDFCSARCLREFLGQNVQALATLPAGASVETVVEVGFTERRRRNSGLVGVVQPRLVLPLVFADVTRLLDSPVTPPAHA